MRPIVFRDDDVGEIHDAVIGTLQTIRIGKIYDEYALQSMIAEELGKAGIPYEKERSLGRGSRADFLVTGGVLIEVKKGKPNRTRLIEQIEKYSKYEEVQAIIIVVQSSIKIPYEKTTNGKRCTIIGLQKLWGIAL